MAEGALFRVHDAEGLPVAEVVLAGHELHPGGGAERLREGVAEEHAFGGEAVEVGRFVGLAAVAAQAFVAEVVGQDEEDVGAFGLGAERGGGESGEEAAPVHP